MTNNNTDTSAELLCYLQRMKIQSELIRNYKKQGIKSPYDNIIGENRQLINQNFADLNYNLATLACQNRQTTVDNARDIIQAGQENTRAILDFLVNDKITTLTNENQALKNAQSQAEQNAYLISQLSQKAPIPAYVVQNPYSANTGCTGCNSTISY